jgi:hypothetical protein
MLSPHQVLGETMALLSQITIPTLVASDHYTNYLDVAGRLPEDRKAMIEKLRQAVGREESTFRPFFIGTQFLSGPRLPPPPSYRQTSIDKKLINLNERYRKIAWGCDAMYPYRAGRLRFCRWRAKIEEELALATTLPLHTPRGSK